MLLAEPRPKKWPGIGDSLFRLDRFFFVPTQPLIAHKRTVAR